jgi:hypothetical protein
VQRGVEVLADLRKPLTDDKAREALFGPRALVFVTAPPRMRRHTLPVAQPDRAAAF